MLRSLGLAGMMTFVLLSAPANALDIVTNDHGGQVEPYTDRLARADARGEPVRIGPVECDSSCTLFLAARRACVSPQAVLGFHAPWVGAPNAGVVDPGMTAMFARSYKPALRRLFLAHVRNSGGAVPGPLMKVSGLQLASMGYRLCGSGDNQQIASARVHRTSRRYAPAYPAYVDPSVMAAGPAYPPFVGWYPFW